MYLKATLVYLILSLLVELIVVSESLRIIIAVTRNHYGEDPDASLSESVVQSESIENDVSMSEVDGFEDVFASQSAEESQTCTVQSQC